MNTVFADAYYYLALVNPRDAGHQRTVEFSQSFTGDIITTEWVLIEVADALSSPELRDVFLELVAQLQAAPGVTIIEASHEHFSRGIGLFARRPDKSWALTDCTSFVTMEEQGLTAALTADHHFVQAGFQALLSD